VSVISSQNTRRRARIRDVVARPLPRIYAPLAVLVAVGLALRVLALTTFTTVDLAYFGGDSTRYLRMPVTGFKGLFGDPGAPAGYTAFLKSLHWLTRDLAFTVGVQHLIGIATGLLLYAAVRRAGAPRWIALVPAAAVLLNGDDIFIEHALLSETLWSLLIVAGLYAAMRWVRRPEGVGWIALAGALLGASVLVRSASLLLPVLLALWAVRVRTGGARTRLGGAALAVAPAAAVVGLYLIVASAVGPYTGLGEMTGWQLYQRVTPFAQCSDFKPPAGSAYLCDSTPPDRRLGGAFYLFNPAAPAAKQPIGPAQASHAEAFAEAAILHQPLDYAKVVAKDLVRYVDPSAGTLRAQSGSTPEEMSFRHWRVAAYQGDTPTQYAARLRADYSGVDATPSGASKLLETWQAVFRGNGLVLLALLALAIAGLVAARGTLRRAGALFTCSALALYVVPPFTIGFDARYGVPPFALLAAGAALGGAGLLARGRTAAA
jgi:hypothetical protein